MDRSEKRAAIIQAHLELISGNRFHRPPVATVAEHAGVASGTISRDFGSKDVLIMAASVDLEERLLKKISQDQPEQGTVWKKFAHLARVLVIQWISSPVEFRFMEQFHNYLTGARIAGRFSAGTRTFAGRYCWRCWKRGL
jgi:AcrR family transcriptional regulator